MAAFVDDAFTDTTGTTLQSHVPTTTGTSWIKTIDPGSDITIQSNAAQFSPPGILGTSEILYRASDTPPTNQYYVEAKVKSSTPTNSDVRVGVVGRRLVDGSNTYYRAFLYGGADGSRGVRLQRVVSGSVTNMGSYQFDWAADTYYTLKLEIKDATKKVFVDTVERISSTNNSITGTGRAGIYALAPNSGSVTCTWDDFVAEGVGIIYTETGLGITISSTASPGDAAIYDQEGRGITAVIVDTAIDYMTEYLRLVEVLTTVSVTVVRVHDETGLLVTITYQDDMNTGSFVKVTPLAGTFTRVF